MFSKDDQLGAGDRFKYLGIQIVGMIVIVLWVAVLSAIYFYLMDKINILRVPLIEEVIGLDIAEMGSAIHISKKVEEQAFRSDSFRKES